MPDLTLLAQQIAIWALPVLLAVTLHEVAHGFAAKKLGDDTAERAGRLSLNPIRHVDGVGTVLLPALLLLLKAPFLFGWAKPVPVNFSRLGRPRRDMAIVAVAGPAANLLMAIAWVSLLWFYQHYGSDTASWALLRDMCVAGVAINLVLMILNLLPLPPLDGGRIAVGLLPEVIARPLAKLERWGFVILVGLLVSGILGKMLFWPLALSEFALYKAFGINYIEP